MTLYMNFMHINFMEFTWHEEKRQINLNKHGLDFVQAHKVFESAILPLQTIVLITVSSACLQLTFSWIKTVFQDDLKVGEAV